MNIKMYKNSTITAWFAETDAHYTLGIDVAPNEGGRIFLTPSPPAGGYIANKRITVTAIASAGYKFSHWEGDLTESTNPISILMDGDKTITAVFGAYYTLVANANPIGTGRITLEPSQPAEGYFQGTRVTITAIAKDGYAFDDWSGALSGSENPATITIDSDEGVMAHFAKEGFFPFPWWWLLVGGGVIIGILLCFLIIGRLLSLATSGSKAE